MANSINPKVIIYMRELIEMITPCLYVKENNIDARITSVNCEKDCNFYEECEFISKECECCNGLGYIEDNAGKHRYDCEECDGIGYIGKNKNNEPFVSDTYYNRMIQIGKYRFNVDYLLSFKDRCGYFIFKKDTGDGYIVEGKKDDIFEIKPELTLF
jgi:hypothetical protein